MAVLAVVAVAVLGTAATLALTSRQVQLPATQVTGISIVPPVESTEEVAQESIEQVPVVLILPDGSTESHTWTEFGIAFQQDEPRVLIDQTKLHQRALQLAQPFTQEPVDATLTIKDGIVLVTPDSSGMRVDSEALANAISTKALRGLPGSIQISTKTVTAAVTLASLEPIKLQLEQLLANGLSVATPEHTYKVSPGELGSWIVVGSTGYSFNDELLRKKVRGIAREQDQEAVPTKVIGTTKQVVEQGQPGVVVDQEATYALLRDALLAGLVSRELTAVTMVQQPGEVAVASAASPTITTGKQIVLVLSEQRVYAWNNNQLENSFLISSGLTGPTPTGDFTIWSRIPVGCMSGPGYNLCDIHWIQYFTAAGHGFHESWWHDNFGQPMSHGCVNMTYEDSKWLYDWSSYGTPVHIVE